MADAAGYVRTKGEQERLDASTGSIRGRILDPDGRPVAGAFAQVRAGCGTFGAQTDARGEFLIPNVNVTWHEVVAVPPFGSDLLRGITPRASLLLARSRSWRSGSDGQPR